MDICVNIWQLLQSKSSSKGLCTNPRDTDYEETFSLVVKWDINQFDICLHMQHSRIGKLRLKLAYLHGVLEEEIYMEQPEGFIAQGEEDKVCRLMHSLYRLKQAGWVWNGTFAHTIKRKLGFDTIHSGAGVYLLHCHHKRGILKQIWSSFYILMTYYSWEKTYPRLKT